MVRATTVLPCRVTVEVRHLPKGCLDGIGERAFVARLAGHVDERGGQGHGSRGEVQGWDRGHVDTVAV